MSADSTRIALVVDTLNRMDCSDRDEVVETVEAIVEELSEIASLLKIAEATEAHGNLIAPDERYVSDDDLCLACNAPLADGETHFRLSAGFAGGYVCPVSESAPKGVTKP